ncbi:hypothetical protein DFH06DRAFT_1438720 [Mycena polygramma]|nr:hypothetical protein DFH06DRAFT_1438720 [Mycena polygramma]
MAFYPFLLVDLAPQPLLCRDYRQSTLVRVSASPRFARADHTLSSQNEWRTHAWRMSRDDDPLPESLGRPCNNDYVIAACFPTFPDSLLRRWFSCDWHHSSNVLSFFPDQRNRWWSRHDLSRFPDVLHHVFDIEGTPRPLAFFDMPDGNILFAVGAEYYSWNGEDSELHSFGSDFTSDTDFLLRIKDADSLDDICVPEIINWDYKKIYRKVDKALVVKAFGQRLTIRDARESSGCPLKVLNAIATPLNILVTISLAVDGWSSNTAGGSGTSFNLSPKSRHGLLAHGAPSLGCRLIEKQR